MQLVYGKKLGKGQPQRQQIIATFPGRSRETQAGRAVAVSPHQAGLMIALMTGYVVVIEEQVATAGDEQVIWLDVPVKDSPRMQSIYCLQGLRFSKFASELGKSIRPGN